MPRNRSRSRCQKSSQWWCRQEPLLTEQRRGKRRFPCRRRHRRLCLGCRKLRPMVELQSPDVIDGGTRTTIILSSFSSLFPWSPRFHLVLSSLSDQSTGLSLILSSGSSRVPPGACLSPEISALDSKTPQCLRALASASREKKIPKLFFPNIRMKPSCSDDCIRRCIPTK